MPTNREIFFKYSKDKQDNINPSIVKNLLIEANGFSNTLEYVKHLDDDVKDLNKFLTMFERISNGESYQYVLGYSYFLSYKLKVNKDVLIPRPETEELVCDVVRFIESGFDKKINICDIGTGSGAIAIGLKKKIENCSVFATDISSNALNIAKENAKDNDAEITFIEGDMLEPIIKTGTKFDVLVSNPPYIQDTSTIAKDVWENEPHLALLANPATLYYEKMLQNVDKIVNDKFLLAFEIGENMEEELTDIVSKYCPNSNFYFVKDIYGKQRFLFVVNE